MTPAASGDRDWGTRRLGYARIRQAPGIPPGPGILDVPRVLERPGVLETAGILQSERIRGPA